MLLSYVDVVDEVLFGGSKGSAERGWEREKRMVDLMGGMSLSEGPEHMYDIGEDVGEDERYGRRRTSGVGAKKQLH